MIDAKKFIDAEVASVKRQVGSDQVICGLSGGVDSAVTAKLVYQAIGDRLTCVFINTGLMREGEPEQVAKIFEGWSEGKIRLLKAGESPRFLTALAGVTDPEEKRRIIGTAYIDAFKNAIKIWKLGLDFKFLAQGTIKPDITESEAGIKAHHNVGGLPDTMGLELVEPLKRLYKEDVRSVARFLGLPDETIRRHPFPGPGLAIRIKGEVTRSRIETVRQADAIFIEELKGSGRYDDISQAMVILLPEVLATGIVDGARTYGQVAVLRAIVTSDFTTAFWKMLPYGFVSGVADRIINEVAQIGRVVMDVTDKPPATIEWE
jgi:GMP synthase (glutamine-hydrolysing)